jgi:hypothetical protein
LGFHLLFLDDFKQRASIGIEAGGEPDCSEFDASLFQEPNLLIKRWKMLGPPIVCEPGDPQFLEHLDTLARSSFFHIEWDNTPRHEVVPGKEFCRS